MIELAGEVFIIFTRDETRKISNQIRFQLNFVNWQPFGCLSNDWRFIIKNLQRSNKMHISSSRTSVLPNDSNSLFTLANIFQVHLGISVRFLLVFFSENMAIPEL